LVLSHAHKLLAQLLPQKQANAYIFILSDNDMTVFIETDNSIVELSDVVLPRKGISYDARRRDNEVLTNR